MVQSGLVDRIDVSHYRLALHLSLAVVIFGLLLMLGLRLDPGEGTAYPQPPVPGAQRPFGITLLALVFVQIVLGAFVAGLKAGFTYNTWPLMDGSLVPPGVLALEPWHLNLFENVATVQFNHRMAAYLILFAALWHALALSRAGADARVQASACLLLVAVVAQAALGVWTLLSVVELALGIAHQAGAVAVFGIAVWHVHRLTSPLTRARASA
jgi:cytochrome c oxidase assembly protein subunit 15